MIRVRLWGGLGNQLFQYAFAYSRHQLTGEDIAFDTSFYEGYKKRAMLLDKFNVTNFETCDINSKEKFLHKPLVNKLIRGFHSFKVKSSNNCTYIKETRRKYLTDMQYKTPDVYYDGYWQAEQYFREYRDDLLLQFTLKDNSFIENNSDLCDLVSQPNSVALHIRRGDYKGLRCWLRNQKPLKLDYYKRAIDEIKSNINNPLFIVFTNDAEWVRENLGFIDNAIFVNEEFKGTDYEELVLMSMCSNFIIANSTYSWWGAYLNNGESKIVIAPKVYFCNKDIIPKEWKRI